MLGRAIPSGSAVAASVERHTGVSGIVVVGRDVESSGVRLSTARAIASAVTLPKAFAEVARTAEARNAKSQPVESTQQPPFDDCSGETYPHGQGK